MRLFKNTSTYINTVNLCYLHNLHMDESLFRQVFINECVFKYPFSAILNVLFRSVCLSILLVLF
jgi:hypothetical protein